MSNELDIVFDEIMNLADRLLLVPNEILIKKLKGYEVITHHQIKNLLTAES